MDLNTNKTLVRGLFLLLVASSYYNISVFLIDWAKGGYLSKDWDWGTAPQFLFTTYVCLHLLNKNFKYLPNPSFLVISLGWLFTYTISAWDWYIYDERNYPYWWGILQSLGFPIFEILSFKVAPLWGLFHSTQGSMISSVGWYFDGGISFSWLVFNACSVFLIITLGINSLSRPSISIKSGESKEFEIKGVMYCTNCGNVLNSTANFCANCGTKTFHDSQKIDTETNALSITQPTQGVDALKKSVSPIKVTMLIAVLAIGVIGIMNSSTNLARTSDSNTQDETGTENLNNVKGYSIRMQDPNQAYWGNYCQTSPGIGWLCIAEVVVSNNSSGQLSPRLSAELVDSKGRTFKSSNSPENVNLTGYFNLDLNPSEKGAWAIYFTTGPDVQFQTLNIYEGSRRVASFPYRCASTITGGMC